jgi:hypothetical protein
MKFVLKINLENDAFFYAPWGRSQELARLLRAVADKVERDEDVSTILDINGNTVGKVEMI